MSLHILQSHQLDYLFTALLQLGFQPHAQLSQVLQAKQLIVPNDAVQAWLKKKLAQAIGISANIQFHQGLASFQWFMYQHFAQKRDHVRDANLPRLVIKWQVYHFLSEMIQQDSPTLTEHHPLYALLQRIYAQGHAFEHATQRYRARQRMLYWISEQCSHVFGYYLLYRPHWLATWSAGQRLDIDAELPTHSAHQQEISDLERQRILEIEQWQSYLWQQLFTERYQDIRQVDGQFWHHLQQQPTQIQRLSSPIFIFTILNLAPVQLEFLRKLARYTDIVVLHFSPTQEYWADSVDPRWKQQQDLKIKQRIRQKFPSFSEQQFQAYFDELNSHFNAEMREARHPLLTRFGKQARDHFSLLSQLSGGELGEQWIDMFNHPESGEPSFAQGILGQLQQDIFYLIDPPAQQYHLGADDRSIQIHICHSVIRQLEVLKEQVLQWLAQGTAEQPRSPEDILVIVPDLSSLEGHIRSLFHSSSQQLPIYITGILSKHAQQAWQSFIFRVRWQLSRFSIQQLSDWLYLPATQQYYALHAQDCARMLNLLEQAGFKRGFDSQHLQQHLTAEDDDYRFSFKYALDRLTMGIAVPELIACQTAEQSIISHHLLQREDLALIDTLLLIYQDFAQRRDWLNPDLAPQYSVVEWLQLLLQELDEWQLAGVEHLEIVRDLIKKYDTMLSLSYHTQKVHHHQQGESHSLKHLTLPLSELLDDIQQQLSEHVEYSEATGAMTFSQIGQIRPLPYALIVVLNLERGIFPARSQPASFDLIQLLRSQLGDRSRLDDHQGAFLDSLLLAQQELWCFYTGFDGDASEILEPSSVLQELIQHLNHLVYRPSHLPITHNKDGIDVPSQLNSLFYIHPNEPFLPSGFSPDYPTRLQDHWYTVAQSLYQYTQAQSTQHLPEHWLKHHQQFHHQPSQHRPSLTMLDGEMWIKDMEFPARTLLRHWNIANARGADVHEEFEPLLLNQLQQYQLREMMVNDLYQHTQDTTELQQQTQAELALHLPIGHLAEPTRQAQLNYRQQLQQRLQQQQLSLTTTSSYTWQIAYPTLQLDELSIQLRLPQPLTQNTWCSVLANAVKGKYRLRIWLRHLFWLAMLDLGNDGKEYQSITLLQNATLITTGISSEQAKSFLAQWFQAWQFAKTTPLLLSAGLVLDNLSKRTEQNWLTDEQPIQLSPTLQEKISKQWHNTYSPFSLEHNENSRFHLHWQFILQHLDDDELLQQNLTDFAHLYYPLTIYQQVNEEE